MPTQQQDCAAVLLPQIQIAYVSSQLTASWLNLVDQQNYSTVQKQVQANSGASGNFITNSLPFGVSGFFNGGWTNFQQLRNSYFSQSSGHRSAIENIAIVRQSLNSSQVTAWLGCIQSQRGTQFVSLDLSNDSAQLVDAKLEYNGIPTTNITFTIDIINGKYQGKTNIQHSLPSGGSFVFTVSRDTPIDTIIINVNSPQGLSDSAASVWPLSVVTGGFYYFFLDDGQSQARLTTQRMSFSDLAQAKVYLDHYLQHYGLQNLYTAVAVGPFPSETDAATDRIAKETQLASQNYNVKYFYADLF